MDRGNNVLARESFWGSLITYLGVSLGFLTTFFVLATYLSPEEVGLTRLLVELAGLLSGLAMLGMSTSISRYFPYFQVQKNTEVIGEGVPHRGFWAWVVRTLSVGLPISLLLYLWGADVFNPFFSKDSALFAEYYLAIVPLTVFLSVWAVAELYAVQLLHLAVPRFIRELLLRLLLLLSYALYALGWVSLTGFVAVFVGAYGLCMLIALLYLGRITRLSLRRAGDFPTKDLRQQMLRYSLWATLSVVGTTLAGRMDLFMLAFVPTAGLRSAAVFSMGFFMVSIVEIPTRSIIALATARIAQMMQSRDFKAVSILFEQVSRYQLLTSLIIYMSILVSIDDLIALMPRGAEYTGSADVFVVLGLSKLIEVSFTASHPIINTSAHYRWSVYYTLWCIVAAFFANYYYIPMWGALGAAVATLLTTLLGYALLQVVLWRHLRLTSLSWAMLRTVLLGLILFGLFPYLPRLDMPYLNIVVRSGLVGLLGLLGTYLLRLAPEGEAYLRGVWEQILCRITRKR